MRKKLVVCFLIVTLTLGFVSFSRSVFAALSHPQVFTLVSKASSAAKEFLQDHLERLFVNPVPVSEGLGDTRPADVFLIPENTLPELQEQYLKDCLLIRFKQGSGLSVVAQDFVRSQKSFAQVTGDHGLDVLNNDYHVSEIKPLIHANAQASHPKLLGSATSSVAKSLEKKKEVQILDTLRKMNNRFAQRSQQVNRQLQASLAVKVYNTFLIVFEEEKENLREIKAQYEKDPFVESVEFVAKAYAFYEPAGDPYYFSSGSWNQNYRDLYGVTSGFLNCGNPSANQGAWEVSHGEGVVVAVIDTGVDYNHPDLATNMWTDSNGYYGYDFYNNDSDPLDDHGHGTHCAGTVAAVENTIGVIGVAPLAKIMAVKGLGANGSSSVDKLMQGIVYAVENGADILSNSWGSSGYSSLLQDVFDFAHASGCVSVAAAGNGNDDASFYSPAAFQSLITVAASDSAYQRASFSNYGTKIDVSAPGVEILSLRAQGTDMYGTGTRIVGNDYYRANGTSMACPHAAGVLALLKSHHPAWTNEELRSALRASAIDLGEVGFDKHFGYGLLNAQRALEIINPLAAKIFSPNHYDQYAKNDSIEIRGVVYGEGFYSYVVEYADSLEGPWIAADNVTPGPKHPEVGPQGEVVYPVLATINAQEKNLFQYVKLTVFDQDLNTFEDIVPILIMGDQKLGWPVNAYGAPEGIEPSFIVSSPVAANLDKSPDGSKEIVVNAPGGLYVFDKDGNVVPGWPKNFLSPYGSGGYSTPALVDLDGDGTIEIISMGYDGINSAQNRLIPGTDEPILGLHVWKHDGTRYSDAWPQPVKNYLPQAISLTYLSYSSPSVGDVDGDGAQDIVFAVRYGVGGGKTGVALLALKQDGTLIRDQQDVTQWPRILSVNNISQAKLLEGLSTPVLVDLNQDGKLEIVYGVTYADDSVSPIAYSSQITAFDAFGNILPGTQWPWILNTHSLSKSILTAADIDHDGEIEIIAKVYNSCSSRFYILSSSGTTKFMFTTFPSLSNFSIGDINGNGIPEIVYSDDTKKLWVSEIINGQLTPLTGWPVVFTGQISYSFAFPAMTPTIADVNGDGQPDIVIASIVNDKQSYVGLKAFDAGGNLIEGWPKFVQMKYLSYSQPTVTDIDLDGKVDVLIANSAGQVLCYDIDQTFHLQAQQWPMFQRDLKHSGWYREEGVVSNQIPFALAGEDQVAQALNSVTLSGSGWDPDGFIVSYLWEQTQGPAVELSGSDQPQASFEAPSVAESTDFVFQLTVIDDQGAQGTDEVTVSVTNPVITVSGTLLDDDGQPIANATINGQDASSGSYALLVPFGEDLLLVPQAQGYTFTPESVTLLNLVNPETQNFIGSLESFAISGSITISPNEAPLSGVEIRDQEGNLLAVSNADGSYSFIQDYGWAGAAHPVKNGFHFNPENIFYENLSSTQAGQDYQALRNASEIGGFVYALGSDLPLEGIEIKSEEGELLAVTNELGYYVFWAGYGSSGKVIPYRVGYQFKPSFYDYESLGVNVQMGQFFGIEKSLIKAKEERGR